MLYIILTILVFLAVIAIIFSLPFAFGVVALMVLIEDFRQGYELQIFSMSTES